MLDLWINCKKQTTEFDDDNDGGWERENMQINRGEENGSEIYIEKKKKKREKYDQIYNMWPPKNRGLRPRAVVKVLRGESCSLPIH